MALPEADATEAAAPATAGWTSSLYPSRIVAALMPSTAAAQPADDRPLLDAARAAQHVLSAIKHGRPELLTRGVFECLPEGLTTRLDSTLTHWNYAGFSFIAAKSALGVGVVVAVAGPSAPILVGIGTGTLAAASSVQNSLVGRAGGAARRTSSSEAEARFAQAYGFPVSELLREHTPIATSFWDLREGDTPLELVLKAKAGLLRRSDAAARAAPTKALLFALLALLGGLPTEAQARLHGAMLRAAAAMGIQPEDARLSAAWQVWHAIDAQAALGAPSIDGAAAQLCTPEGGAISGGEVALLTLTPGPEPSAGPNPNPDINPNPNQVELRTLTPDPELNPNPNPDPDPDPNPNQVELLSLGRNSASPPLDPSPSPQPEAEEAEGGASEREAATAAATTTTTRATHPTTPAAATATTTASASASATVTASIPVASASFASAPAPASTTSAPAPAPTPATAADAATVAPVPSPSGGAAAAGMAAATGFWLAGPPGALLALGAAAATSSWPSRGEINLRAKRAVRASQPDLDLDLVLVLEQRIGGTAWATLLLLFEQQVEHEVRVGPKPKPKP